MGLAAIVPEGQGLALYSSGSSYTPPILEYPQRSWKDSITLKPKLEFISFYLKKKCNLPISNNDETS